ncbi:MAG: capsular biosynthesis protein [Bacteroidetes bacterium]|nr:capsular biosynthesis protein [Bacteroidota bacterium]
MKIAIDFDGVIHGYSQGWHDGTIYDPPVPGTKEALTALKEQGHYLIIFSTRTNKIFRKKDDPDQEPIMKAWLAQHEIPYDKIWTFGKPMADVYLDDRAVTFRGDWQAAVQAIQGFTPWNKEQE